MTKIFWPDLKFPPINLYVMPPIAYTPTKTQGETSGSPRRRNLQTAQRD